MLLALLLATTLACQPSGSTAFVGLWETAAPAGGDGIGHTIELRTDGSFVSAMTVRRPRPHGLTDGAESISKDRGARPHAGPLFVQSQPFVLPSQA
jgi:hypothetical protein